MSIRDEEYVGKTGMGVETGEEEKGMKTEV